MANVKISQLPALSSLGGSDVFPVVSSGTTYKITAANVQAYVSSNLGTLSVLSVSGNITSGNLLTGGLISVTGNVTGGNVLTGGLISVTGNVTGGNITTAGVITVNSSDAVTAIINGGTSAVGNVGSEAKPFNTVFALATSAQYADLAEKYLSDQSIEPGTVVSLGGSAEVCVSTADMDTTIAGVVSTNPAYIMNGNLEGNHVVTVALTGRVPCRVTGPVSRGQMLVSAGDGSARAETNPVIGSVIGKAVGSSAGGSAVIEILVGRI